MNWSAITFVILVSCLPVLKAAENSTNAASAEARYVEVCDHAVQADRLSESGSSDRALALYQEAQTDLTRMQVEFPEWSKDIVSLRLSYIARRIAALAGAMPAERARVLPAPEPVPQVAGAVDITNQLQSAWQRLRAIEADRSLLQGKLREALAAQPASVDPREMARAEERAQELLKENEVLRADLDKKMENSPAARSSEVQRMKKTISDLKMELEAQARAATSLLAESGLKRKEETKRALALAVERDSLKKQLESGAGGKELTRLNTENEKLRKSLAEVQAEAQATAGLKRQVKDAQASLTRAESEKKQLQERLQTLSSTSPGDEELRKQLEQVQASLRVVEGERDVLRQKPASTTSGDAETRLKEENSQLRSQLDQVNVSGDAAALNRQLDQVREALRTTESERDSLKTQVALADPSRQTGKLREENESLRKELAGARTTAKKSGSDLENAQKELNRTRARLAATEKERKALELAQEDNEKRLAEARKAQTAAEKQAKKTGSNLEDAQKDLNLAQARMAGMEKDRKALEQAQEDNEKRLAEARKAQVAAEKLAKQEADRAKDMEKEQEKLRRKLADADHDLARKNVKNADSKFASLNEAILKLRAKLDVYESKPVPYTPEELALFQKPAPAQAQVDVTKSDTPTASHPGRSTAVLVASGRNEKSVQSADAAVPAIPTDTGKDVRGMVAEAAQLAESGKLDEADKKVQEALALNPGSGSAQSFLGYVRFSQGRFDDALDALTRASQIRQDDPGILNMMGLVLINKGMRGQAETSFRRALQTNPGFADSHLNLATLYLSQKPPLATLARWHYQKAISAGASRSEDFEKKLEAAANQTPGSIP